jgi:WD40 repeat protein
VQRPRRLAAALLGIALAAVAATVAAVVQTMRANDQRTTANSRALAAEAVANVPTRTDLGALLAVEAMKTRFTPEARSAAISIAQLTDGFAGILPGRLSEPIDDLAYTADGRHLVSVNAGRVVVWNARTHRVASLVQMDAVTADASIDGRWIAAADGEGHVRVWHDRKRTSVNTAAFDVQAVAFSPRSGKLATVGFGRSVVLWDLRTGRRRVLAHGRDKIENATVTLDPHGTVLTEFDEHSIRRWNASTGRLISRWVHPFHQAEIVLGDGGKRAALISGRRDEGLYPPTNVNVAVWDVVRRKLLARLRFPEGVADAAFDPTGRRLAVATADGRASVLALPGGQRVQGPTDAQGGAVTVAFAADGALAIGGRTGAITLVAPSRARARTTLRIPGAPARG